MKKQPKPIKKRHVIKGYVSSVSTNIGYLYTKPHLSFYPEGNETGLKSLKAMGHHLFPCEIIIKLRGL